MRFSDLAYCSCLCFTAANIRAPEESFSLMLWMVLTFILARSMERSERFADVNSIIAKRKSSPGQGQAPDPSKDYGNPVQNYRA